MDPQREAIAREVERRWAEYERAPRPWPLGRRDAEVREILDDNVAAFERARAPGETTTLAEAQQGIVDSIEMAQERTLGHRAIVDFILRVARRRHAARGGDGPIRLLEAAAGSGWLERHLWRRARQRRLPVELEASDYNAELVESLRARFLADHVPCAVRQGDARAMLDLEDGARDVAFMTYTLHHFAPADAALCLRELDRVSGGGLALVDLSRHPFNLAALPITMKVLTGIGRYGMHDTLASTRRAYTVRELRLLLDWVGLGDRYRVGALPTLHPQRLVAVAIWPG